MKVEKCITVQTEVEVDVGVEDITACILEELDRHAETDREIMFEVERGLVRAVTFLKACPERAIAKMRPGPLAEIVKILRQEADRYAAFHPAPAATPPSVPSVSSVVQEKAPGAPAPGVSF